MVYEQWSDAAKMQLEADIRNFLKKIGAKYRADVAFVPLDDPGSFAFKIKSGREETEEEKQERLAEAEIYLRAWLAILNSPAKPPHESYSIYKNPIEVSFPSDDETRMVTYVGKIIDIETKVFARDPLVIIQNSAKKPKVENEGAPAYFEIIECRASQIVSFFPKGHQKFTLIKKDGTEVEFPKFPQIPNNEDDPEGPEAG